MKETGIIMSGDHPVKILNGEKTMTRRVITPQPHIHTVSSRITHCRWQRKLTETILMVSYPKLEDVLTELVKLCPYGQVGDRLWVRETFVIECDIEYGHTAEEIKLFAEDRPIKIEEGYNLIPHYRATEPEPHIVTEEQFTREDDHTLWKPSIHMPRWASRILLEITGVRVERLQEIIEDDAFAEGFKSLYPALDFQYAKDATPSNPKVDIDTLQFTPDSFLLTWQKLNEKRGYGWEANPWVWVISFKLVETR